MMRDFVHAPVWPWLLGALVVAGLPGCGDDGGSDGDDPPEDAGAVDGDDDDDTPDAGGDDGDAGPPDGGAPDGGTGGTLPGLPVQCRVDADCPTYDPDGAGVALECDGIPRGRCFTFVPEADCELLSCPAGTVCELEADVFAGQDFVFCTFPCEGPADCGPGLTCRDGNCNTQSVCGDACDPYVCEREGDVERCERPSCADASCPTPFVCSAEEVCVEPEDGA